MSVPRLNWLPHPLLHKRVCVPPIWILGGHTRGRSQFGRPARNSGTLSTLHCKDTIQKIQRKYSHKRNCAASAPISTLMCLWAIFIYSHDRSAYSAAGKYVDRSWEHINRSQKHECGNLDWGRAISFMGIHKWDFRSSVWLPFLLVKNVFILDGPGRRCSISRPIVWRWCLPPAYSGAPPAHRRLKGQFHEIMRLWFYQTFFHDNKNVRAIFELQRTIHFKTWCLLCITCLVIFFIWNYTNYLVDLGSVENEHDGWPPVGGAVR